MTDVSATGLADRLQAAVEAQAKVVQASQAAAQEAKAARDAEPIDRAETEDLGEEAEA